MRQTYTDYVDTVANLARATDDARASSAAASRKQADDLQELATRQQDESRRIQTRMSSAASRYREAARVLEEQPVAGLGIRLPERVHPAAEPRQPSTRAEHAQNRATQALAQAVSAYNTAHSAHQGAAASAADALAARRAALVNQSSPAPWWRTPRTAGAAGIVVGICVLVVLLLIVT